MTTQPGSFLATRRGRLTLLLLCAVQFLDVADSSIMNVALPSIRRDLGFSVQGLQWVLSGYLVTYGGLLLLGGRAADLLGRRRLLAAGTTLFAACSLAGGLAVGRGHAGRRPARAGRRRGDDGAGRAVDPDHHVQPGHRPQPGARRLGRGLRARRRRRRVPRRRAVAGPGLAVGAVRQPAGLRADPRRRLPPPPGESSAAPGWRASTSPARSWPPAACCCWSTPW